MQYNVNCLKKKILTLLAFSLKKLGYNELHHSKFGGRFFYLNKYLYLERSRTH